MEKTLIAIACVLGLGFIAPNAGALVVGDSAYVGRILPSVPSSLAQELGYITELINLDPEVGYEAPCVGQVSCDRYSSTIASLPGTSSLTSSTKDDGDTNASFDNIIDVTGATYLLAKYDQNKAGGFVWLVAGMTGDVSVPEFMEGLPGVTGGPFGLSHISLFGVSVPDGAVTLILLSVSLVGLEALRRRFRA